MGQDYVETREIGGATYEVRMFDPDTAVDVFTDLLTMLGPSVGALFDSEKDGEASDGGYQGAIEALVRNVDKAKVKAVIQALAKVSFVGGVSLDGTYRVHFTGKLGDMLKWIGFGLKVQYKDFGDAFGSIPGLQIALRKAPGGL